uniref:Probable ATP-dependent RNA helicase spindle-E n=1 Tax=Glossina brevipalpis TaxID=37001 RepID=A0A1A9WKS7_9MUSC
MQREVSVIVTHFINPHMFWYHEVGEFAQFNELEQRLQVYKEKRAIGYRPKVGEKVAINFIAWNKVIRAEILCEAQWTNEYIVWASDYGFPFRTEKKHMRSLPINLTQKIDRIRCGGLINILPAESDYDYMEDKVVMTIKDNWRQNACTSFEKLLLDATSITFIDEFQSVDNRHWGNLVLVSYKGEIFDARDYLITNKYALEEKKRFKNITVKLNTIQIPSYFSNCGKLTMNINAMKSGRDNLFKVHGSADALVQQAIEDDRARNKRRNNFTDIKSISGQNTPTEIHDRSAPKSHVNINNYIGKKHSSDSIKLGAGTVKLPEAKYFDVKPALNPQITNSSSTRIEDDLSNHMLTNISSTISHKVPFDTPYSSEYTQYEQPLKLSHYTNSQESLIQSTHQLAKNLVNKEEEYICETTSNFRIRTNADKKNLKLKTIKMEDSGNIPTGSCVNIINRSEEFTNFQSVDLVMAPRDTDRSVRNKYSKDANHWHHKKTISFDKLSTRNSMNMKPNESHGSVRANTKSEETTQHNTIKCDFLLKPRKCPSMKCSPPLIVKKTTKDHSFKLVKDVNLPLATTYSITATTTTTSSKDCETRHELGPVKTQFDKIAKISEKPVAGKKLGDANVVNLTDTSFTFMEPNISSSLDLVHGKHDLISSNSRLLLENHVRSGREEIDIESLACNEQISSTIVVIKKKTMMPVIECEKKIETYESEVLAHSNVPLTRLKSLNDAHFLPMIHDEMLRMGRNKVYRIQTYAWLHLLRNNSLLIVNPTQSGKTWSYLPALCNNIYFDVSDLKPTYGPISIVLVASTKHVELIADLCRRLLRNLNDAVATTIVASFGLRNLTDTKIKLLNSCGVLIATPSSLLRLLNDNENDLFDAERLKRIVIDDMDLILSRASEDFEIALKTLFTMCKKTEAKTLAIQVIVTSRSWNDWFIKILRLLNHPLLLIGDFLEAAVYGKVELSIILRSKLEKNEVIRGFLQKYNESIYVNNRTMILCKKDDDVEEVIKYLQEYGYNGFGYYSYSTEEERRIINEWKYKISNQILVCIDAGLADLQIRNVQNLIHYSMPSSWTQFTTRFSVLQGSYDNFLINNFEKMLNYVDNTKKVRSLILLDEDNNEQLPRLVHFMRMHDQIVHPNIRAVAKSLLKAREEARICEGVQLCSDVLEFGECDEPHCIKRHEITSLDVVTEKDDIPMNGELRVHILQVFSPTHYAARLMEHKPIHSNEWSDVKYSREAVTFAVQLNLHYRDPNNTVQHWPPEIGDICVYKYLDVYRRVRILDMPPVPKNATVIQDSLELTLKLIDDGLVVPKARSCEIFFCDPKFKDFPCQAIDIRLMNMVPYDNERVWDSMATDQVRKWIRDDIKANQVVHVSVNFALASTIWINNLVVMEKMPTIDTYVQLIHLKMALIARKLALHYKGDRKSVRDIASEEGLLKIPLVELENRYNLDKNNKNRSENSTNFIKLSFSGLHMDSSATGVTKINGLKSKSQIQADAKNICEQRENMVDRGLELKEENWDTVSSHDKLESKTKTPNKFESRMDDKLDQCKESWSELSLNKLIKIEIGDESENGNWENLFVQLIDPDSMRKFNQLIEMIKEHVENTKANCNNDHRKNYDLQLLHNCIIKYNHLYLRAKLVCITTGNEINKCLYKFFLCDYACFINIKSEDLYKDCFYETSEAIVNFTPYQAIHCNLAGIQWNCHTKRFYVTKSYLYVRAVCDNSREIHNIMLQACCNLPINSYMVLLYECGEEDDFKHATLFNKILLDNAIAIADPETKHFLTIDFEKQEINEENSQHRDTIDKLVTFNELFECLQNCDELDVIEFMEFPGQEETSERPLRVSKEANELYKKTRSLDKINKLPEKTKSQEAEKLTLLSQDDCPIPSLKALHKCPQTTWHQTNCIIFLSIYAPDIKNYYLEVGSDELYFAADIHGEEHILILHLLGSIQPKLISHELRGLNVIVRLVKSICLNWPRLLINSTKVSWLTYNYAAVDVHEIDKVDHQPLLGYASEDGTDSDNDSEVDLFETYNHIENGVDDTDPFSKFFS